MAQDRPPEQTIRDWLESNGPARVGIGAIEQTWGISPLGAADRREIAAALESAGVLCEPPLTRAGRNDRLRLSVVEVADEPAPLAEEPPVEEEPPIEEPQGHEPDIAEEPVFEERLVDEPPIEEPPVEEPPPAAPPRPAEPPAVRRGRPRSPRRLLDRQRARRSGPPTAQPAPPPSPRVEEDIAEPEPESLDLFEPIAAPEPEPAAADPEPDVTEPEPEPEAQPDVEPEAEAEPEPAPAPEPDLEAESPAAEEPPATATSRRRDPEARRRRRAERAERDERQRRARAPSGERRPRRPDREPEPAFESEPATAVFAPPAASDAATASRPAEGEAAPSSTARSRLLPFGVALLVMVVGSLAPWSKAVFTVDTGFDRSGPLILAIAVLAGVTVVLALRETAPSWLPYVAAGLGALAIAITAGNFRDIVDDSFVEPAWGLYLSFVGSAALVVLSMFLTVKRSD